MAKNRDKFPTIFEAYGQYVPPADTSDRDRLIFDNIKLVLHFARKYKRLQFGRFLPSFDDLVQFGMMGLVHATKGGFDPSKGQFNTYAGNYIKKYMLSALGTGGVLKHGDKPRATQKMLRAASTLPPSRQHPPDNNERPPEFAARSEMSDMLCTALARLKPKERSVVERRWGLGGKSEDRLREIAADFGITGERVRQIEEHALKKLRCYLEDVVNKQD